MKAKKKNGQGLYLQTRNNRWKWMAGATAATAAGVTASQASTITINLLNNYISGSVGNHLNADVTGDGRPDVAISGAMHFLSYPRTYNGHIITSYRKSSAAVVLNGIAARAYFSSYPLVSLRLGSQHTGGTYDLFLSLTGSIPLSFRDRHINGGALTEGSLEVTVTAFGSHGRTEIQLDSLTYNTRVNIPDQGSTLALLAMGAGGVLALRRWRGAKSSKPQLPAQAP
jgi:hypothetical protein